MLLQEKITRELAPLIGQTGVLALFARSAKLARAELPEGVTLTGPADRPLAFLTQLEPAVAREAATATIAAFLGLMTSLLGDALTRQLLRRACPAIDGPSKESS